MPRLPRPASAATQRQTPTILALSLLLAVAQAGVDAPWFSDEIVIAQNAFAGVAPTNLDAGDLDGDGDYDLVMSGFAGEKVYILANTNGLGAFTLAGTLDTAGSTVFTQLLWDINGDGALDILTGSDEAGCSYFLGLGLGLFADEVRWQPTKPGCARLSLCDLDGDGEAAELVVAMVYSGVFWYEWTGSDFTEHVIDDGLDAVGARDATCQDMDGDGDDDVAVSVAGLSTDIRWYEQLADGSWADEVVIDTLDDFAVRSEWGDVDGDGDNDWVLPMYAGDEVYLVKNLGGGSFDPEQIVHSQNTPSDCSVVDINGDGAQDTFIWNSADQSMLYSTATGWQDDDDFNNNLIADSTIISNRGCAAVFDADADGDLDIATAGAVSGHLALLVNDLIPLAEPDAIADLAADAQYAGRVVLSWSAPSANGAEIESYTVTATPGTTYVLDSTARSRTFDGLDPAVPYSFSVTATNRIGISTAATVAGVSPLELEFEPRAVVGDAGAAIVRVVGLDSDVAALAANGNVTIFYNDDTVGGSFTAASLSSTTAGDIASGDVNGDGAADLVLAGVDGGVAVLLAGASDTTPVAGAEGLEPASLLVIDDGTIVLSTAASGTWTGTMAGMALFDAAAPAYSWLAAADVGLDAATGFIAGTGPCDAADVGDDGAVLCANATAVYRGGQALAQPGADLAVAALDLDQNGAEDALFASADGQVSWIDSTQTVAVLSAATGATTLSAVNADVDLDADGDADVLLGFANGTVQWLANRFTVVGVPGAVGNLTLAPSYGGFLNVSWEPPADTGNLEVLGYLVNGELETSGTSVLLSDYAEGAFASVDVRAHNRAGYGPASAANATLLSTFGAAATISDTQDALSEYNQDPRTCSGDIDGDGDVDLFVAEQDGDERFMWVENVDSVGGELLEHTLVDIEQSATAIVAGDVDDDGDLDWASASQDDGFVYVGINDGLGNFAVTLLSDQMTHCFELSLVDVNLDGHVDVLAVQPDYLRAVAFYGDGQGNFGGAVGLVDSVGVTIGPMFYDVNYDGAPDILIPNLGTQQRVAYGDGLGGYGDLEDLVVSTTQPNLVEYIDVDGDGREDMVACGYEGVDVCVYHKGNEAGFWGPLTALGDGSVVAYHLQQADLDLNGYNDLLINMRGAGSTGYTVWLPGSADGLRDAQVLDDPERDGDGRDDNLRWAGAFDRDSDGDLDVLLITGGPDNQNADGTLFYWYDNGIIEATLPEQVTDVTATPQFGGVVTVAWDEPFNGNARISEYLVSVDAAGGNATVTASAATEVDIGGLSTAEAYSFTVTAVNRIGAGPTSAVVGPVTPLDLFEVPQALADNATTAVAAADLDSDGDVDLLFAVRGGLYWLENTDTLATWAAAEPLDLSLNWTLAIAATADVDQDGDVDVVTAGYGQLVVDGAPLDSTGDFFDVAVTDLSGDGYPDVVAVRDDAVAVYYNYGNGSLRADPLLLGAGLGARRVEVTVLSLGGELDLLCASADAVWWYGGIADNELFAQAADVVTQTAVSDLAIADVDGDGDDDIVLASPAEGAFWIPYDSALGSIGSPQAITGATAFAEVLVAADADGDGDVDVALASDDAGVAWYVNDGGDGSSWGVGTVVDSAVAASALALADLEGDGDADLVAATASALAVYESAALELALPDAPRNVSAEGAVGGVRVAWDSGATDSVGYTITQLATNRTFFTTTAAGETVVPADCASSAFVVQTVSRVGSSAASDASADEVLPLGVCPTTCSAVAGDSGQYYIAPAENGEPFLAECDMDTDGGGWTVLSGDDGGDDDVLALATELLYWRAADDWLVVYDFVSCSATASDGTEAAACAVLADGSVTDGADGYYYCGATGTSAAALGAGWAADAASCTGENATVTVAARLGEIETALLDEPGEFGNATALASTFRVATNPPGVAVEAQSSDDGEWVALEAATAVEGPQTWQLRASAFFGDDETPLSYTWVVDTTPPTAFWSSDPPSYTSSNVTEFLWGANEDGVEFEFRLDGEGAWESIVVFDSADTVLETPPETTLAVDEDAGVATADSDAVDAVLQYMVDGAGDWVNFDGSLLLDDAAATPGWHYVSFRAVSAGGLEDPSPESYAWLVSGGSVLPDLTPPETTAAFTQNDTVVTADEPLGAVVSASEDNCTLALAVDGAAVESVADLSGLALGVHVLTATATDAAGNADPTPAVLTWTVVDAPVAVVLAAPAESTIDNNALFVFDASGGTECAFEWATAAGLSGTAGYDDVVVGPQAVGPHSLEVVAVCAEASSLPVQVDWEVTAANPSTVGFTTGALADGEHSFLVRVADLALNRGDDLAVSFVVDSVAPETEAAWNGTAVELSCVGGEACTFEWALSGARNETGVGAAVAVPDEGSFELEAVARDLAGNADPSAYTVAFVVDYTPPETFASMARAFASLRVNVTDAYCEDALSACAVEPAAGASWLEADDGNFSVSFTATDAAGNVDASPVTLWYVVDTQPPAATVHGVSVNGSTLTVDATCDDGANTAYCAVEVTVDGEPFASPGALEDGDYVVEVCAVDIAGTRDCFEPTTAVSVDVLPPTTAVAAPAYTNATRLGDVVSLSCDDADGCSFAVEPEGVLETEVAADGAYSFSVRATDDAGNVESVAVEVEVVVDTAAPAASVLLAPEEASAVASPNVTVLFECGESLAPTTAHGDTSAEFADGAHSVEGWCSDAAGNVGASVWASFSVDTTPPATALATRPGALLATAFAVLESAADGDTVALVVDGALYASTRVELGPLGDAEYALDVFAVDAAGNEDAAGGLEVAFRVDTTPPVTVVNAPPAFVTEPRLSLNVTCEDAAPCPSFVADRDLDDLADGRYSVLVQAVDAANWTDPAGVAVDFVVDTTPPQLSLPWAPAVTAAAAGEVDVNCSDALSLPCDVWVSVDGGALQEGSAWAVADEGRHAVLVHAADAVGNAAAAPANWSFVVDWTPPSVWIAAGPAARSREASPVFEVACSEDYCLWSFSLDGEPAASAALSDVAEGAHEFCASAEDAAGTVAAEAACAAWEVDTTAPEVVFTGDVPARTVGTDDVLRYEVQCQTQADGCDAAVADDDCAFAWWWDGAGAWDTSSGSLLTLSALAAGDYELVARATDSAGNEANLTYAFTVTQGTVTPEIGDLPPIIGEDVPVPVAVEAPSELSDLVAQVTDTALEYAFTGADGGFVLGGLPAGTWELVVSVVGNADAVATQTLAVARCEAGQLQQPDTADGALDCDDCPDGAVCDGSSDAVLADGYWWRGSTITASSALFDCRTEDACVGGSSNATCNEGYTGFMCDQCEDGYGQSLSGECVACGSSDNAAVAVFVVMLIVVLVGGAAVFVVQRSLSAAESAKGGSARRSVAMVKIIANYLLMMSILKDLDLDWGSMLSTLFMYMGVASGGGAAELRLVNCVARVDQFTQYRLLFLVPVFVLVGPALALAGYWHRGLKVWGYDARYVYRQAVTVLAYFVYPLVIQTALRVFNCREIDGREWLVDDYTKECAGAEYNALFGTAVFFSTGIAVGVPAAMLFAVNKQRDAEQWAFIVAEYRAEYFAWEILVMTRKVFMGAIAVLLADHEQNMQVYAGTWLLLFSFTAQITCGPHADPLQRVMETVAQGTVLASLMLGQGLAVEGVTEAQRSAFEWCVMVLNVFVVNCMGVVIARELYLENRGTAVLERVSTQVGQIRTRATRAWTSSQPPPMAGDVESPRGGVAPGGANRRFTLNPMVEMGPVSSGGPAPPPASLVALPEEGPSVPAAVAGASAAVPVRPNKAARKRAMKSTRQSLVARNTMEL